MTKTPRELRQQFRRLRAQLTREQQLAHAQSLAQNIDRFIGFHGPMRIAGYLAVGGEISLGPWMQGNQLHQLYLPKLYEVCAPQLRFARYRQTTRWSRNRFGIVEPIENWGDTLHPRELDLVLTPLVAFDRRGNRLGMGGGYYDRSMAFRRHRQHWQKPRLVGIAHQIQEYPELPRAPWDVPLDAIITERGIIRPRSGPIG